MRDICGILGVNRGSFYYHRQEDPSEAVLRSEIEKLAGQYPRYGYRRITQLLQRQGYTVGTRRVAGLMKEMNLLVSVKRVSGHTTKSLQGEKPWTNRLETLEVSRQDQVRRFIIPIKACSIFQRSMLPRSKHMALRFLSLSEDALGRTGMPKDSSEPSRRKKSTSMTIKALPRREIASDSLSNKYITRNAHIRR